MTPEQEITDYSMVKELFSAALDLSPKERAAFLDQHCTDKNVRGEVASLLEAREEAGEFLNNISAAETVQNVIDTNKSFIGQKINNYRIEKEIGRGGMGIVFLATREDFHQQAAIKLIKRGMDSDAILERFTREREILATLNNPYIARLTDGGTTKDNLPYFVMEYVEGVAVDKYCESNNLSEKEILGLFRKICEAVTFAHQKLVVHRDLKPSNILVTADGTPKLLDFGIAKLLNSTDASETQTNQRVLTPAYASPEQISGKPIDTTSDVYSLGKILAELLAGKDQTVPMQKLNADLRNILTVSLREDAARRYASVERFSEDIRCYLAGLPVSACRDTFSYRSVKFIKRNSLAIIVSALFVLTLLIGSIATLWQAREAQRERQVAERRLENLRKMSDSFTTEIHDAIENLPGSLPARRMLMLHAVEQLDALATESDGNPLLMDELAEAYFNSTHLPDMLLVDKDATLRKEIEIYRQLIAKNPANIHYQEQMALGYASLGDITKVRGSLADSLEDYKISLSMLEKVIESEPDSIEHRLNLSSVLLETVSIYTLEGNNEMASELIRQTVAVNEEIRKLNENEPQLISLIEQTKLDFCAEQTSNGNYSQAIETLQQILSRYEIQATRNTNDTSVKYYLFVINRRLAFTLDKSGDIQSAAKHLQTAVTIIEQLLADSPKDFGYHRNSAATHNLIGELLIRRKDYVNSIEHFRRAIELSNFVLESDTDNSESKTDLARATADLGNAFVLIGKTKEGTDNLKKALVSLQEIYAHDNKNIELKRIYLQTQDWLKVK